MCHQSFSQDGRRPGFQLGSQERGIPDGGTVPDRGRAVMGLLSPVLLGSGSGRHLDPLGVTQATRLAETTRRDAVVGDVRPTTGRTGRLATTVLEKKAAGHMAAFYC